MRCCFVIVVQCYVVVTWLYGGGRGLGDNNCIIDFKKWGVTRGNPEKMPPRRRLKKKATTLYWLMEWGFGWATSRKTGVPITVRWQQIRIKRGNTEGAHKLIKPISHIIYNIMLDSLEIKYCSDRRGQPFALIPRECSMYLCVIGCTTKQTQLD